MIGKQEDYDNLLSLVRGENRKCLEDLAQIEDLEEFSILLCQIFQVGIYERLINDLVQLFLFFHDKVDFAVEAAILSLEEILEERTCPRIRWSETIELMTALLNLEYKTNQGTVELVDKRGKIMEFIAKFILQRVEYGAIKKEGADKGRVLDIALHFLLVYQERIEAQEREIFLNIFMRMKYTVIQIEPGSIEQEKVLSSLLLLAKSDNVTEEMCVGEIASFLDSSDPSVISCMVRPPIGSPLCCSSLRNSPDVHEIRAEGDQTLDRRKRSTPINTSPENRFTKEIGMYTSNTLPPMEEGILLGSDHDVLDNGFSGSFSELIEQKKGEKHPEFEELHDHKETAGVDVSVDLNKASYCLQLEDQLDFENILPTIVEEKKKTDVKILGTLVDFPNSVEYIVKNKVIIGRDKECDILLSDSTVSREHAVLEVNSDGQIIITALNKTVIISKKKIASGSSQVLQDKDELRFGNTILGWRENTGREIKIFPKTTGSQIKLDVFGKPTSTISRMDPHLSIPSDYGRIPVTPSAKFSGWTPVNWDHNSTQKRPLNPAQISASPVPVLSPIRPNPQVSTPPLDTKPVPITGNKTTSTKNQTPSTGNQTPSSGSKTSFTKNQTCSTENQTPSSGNKPPSSGNNPPSTEIKPLSIKPVSIKSQRHRLLEDAHHLFETQGLKPQPRLKRSPSIKVPDKIPKVQISKDYGRGAFRMHHGLFPCVVLVKPELSTKLKDQCGIIDGFLKEHMEIQGIEEDVNSSSDSSF